MELEQKGKYQMELEKKDSNDNINKTIVNNTKVLVGQLPQNSPFRRPLLFFLLQGLSCKEAIDLYDISQRSYGRIMKDDGSVLVDQKYALNVTRTKVSEEQIEEICGILGDILPVVSGRKYRYLLRN